MSRALTSQTCIPKWINHGNTWKVGRPSETSPSLGHNPSVGANQITARHNTRNEHIIPPSRNRKANPIPPPPPPLSILLFLDGNLNMICSLPPLQDSGMMLTAIPPTRAHSHIHRPTAQRGQWLNEWRKARVKNLLLTLLSTS